MSDPVRGLTGETQRWWAGTLHHSRAATKADLLAQEVVLAADHDRVVRELTDALAEARRLFAYAEDQLLAHGNYANVGRAVRRGREVCVQRSVPEPTREELEVEARENTGEDGDSARARLATLKLGSVPEPGSDEKEETK